MFSRGLQLRGRIFPGDLGRRSDGEGIRKEGGDRKKEQSQDILHIGRLDIPVLVGNKSGMKKFFSLEASNHRPARLADKIKSEVRKYLKRERSKELAEGVDFWDFDCRQGGSSENAQSLHEKEIGKAIDRALAAEWKGIYLEILAKPGVRTKRER